jgi:peptidase S41-like protein
VRAFRLISLVLAGTLLWGTTTIAQTASAPAVAVSKDQLIKSADLLIDAGVLRQAFEELHPGIYRYSTKAEMDAYFAELQTKLSHDLTLEDAYLAFSIFAAKVKCGHTYGNFFNQKDSVAAALFRGQNRVPFYFKWLNRKMIVIEDFTPDHRLPRGTEISSINGIPVGTILDRLMTIARADGSNNAKRIAYLEVTGDSVYEAFDVYFPIFFPQTDAPLQLSAQRPGEKNPQTLTVTALTYEQRIAPIKAREAGRKGGDDAIFDWNYLQDGTGYLRMPTWALYNSKWDWKTWLDSHLDELADKSSPALIIDLRGNEGGNDIGDEILKRLVHSDLKIATYRRLVRYRQTPAALNPYLDTWDPSFKNWGTDAKELEQAWPTAPPVHYFALTKYGDEPGGYDVIRPAKKPFLGKVYVLIDASNSSATFQFIRIVQENKLGFLVGQSTGGNLRGINGGAFFFLRLPKSQIELDLPLVGAFPASPQPDTGISPDVPVTPSIADIVAGKDVWMEAVDGLQRK